MKQSVPKQLPPSSGTRPQSRNAANQARHRARIKAYIAKLEDSLELLQAELVHPPGTYQSLKNSLCQMEDEVAKLQGENASLKAQLMELRAIPHEKHHASSPAISTTWTYSPPSSMLSDSTPPSAVTSYIRTGSVPGTLPGIEVRMQSALTQPPPMLLPPPPPQSTMVPFPPWQFNGGIPAGTVGVDPQAAPEYSFYGQ